MLARRPAEMPPKVKSSSTSGTKQTVAKVQSPASRHARLRPVLCGFQVATAINNHYDTDGLLCVFTLQYPELALSLRDLLARLWGGNTRRLGRAVGEGRWPEGGGSMIQVGGVGKHVFEWMCGWVVGEVGVRVLRPMNQSVGGSFLDRQGWPDGWWVDRP